MIKSDGNSRARVVDNTPTVNRNILSANHGQCPIGSLIVDTAAGVQFITVCDVQNAQHQIHAAESDTENGSSKDFRLPLGIAKAPFIFSWDILSIYLRILVPKSGFVYMDDCVCCSFTWESHLALLEVMFKALQVAGLTLKPTKMQRGPKLVSQILSTWATFCLYDGIRVCDDRIKVFGRSTHAKK